MQYLYTKMIRGVLGDLYFQDYTFITDTKLVIIELFKCIILKEHVLIYINACFKILGALVFTLEVFKLNHFHGFHDGSEIFSSLPFRSSADIIETGSKPMMSG